MIRRYFSLAVIALVPLFTVACSASNGSGTPSGFGGDGNGNGSGGGPLGSSNGGSGGGIIGTSAGGSAGTGMDHNCSAASQLVYVVSQERGLYSFNPGALAFTKIGDLDCPANGGQPFSMAVDRQGNAWVLYDGGAVWQVSTATAHCTATTYQRDQNGFAKFGMGFSTNGMTTSETLYLANYNGSGLGSLNTTSFAVTAIGSYDTLHKSAELTGTGDGRLFGFFETATIQIAEIDKTDAHIISTAPQPTISIGDAWAFAFWGGSFWLFTNPNGDGSQVDQYNPMAKTTTTVVPQVMASGQSFSIVGAGVSTCAPVTPPK